MGGIAPHRGREVAALGKLCWRRFLLVLLGAALALAMTACASSPRGFHHEVRKGENLYRIGLRYGVDARTLARANGIRDVTALQIGQRLWIPSGDARGQGSQHASVAAKQSARAPSPTSQSRRAARERALETSQLSFAWPLERPDLTSRFGQRRGRPHEGIDLAAKRGSRIRAAEAGKVIHSGWLGDYGQVVIVKHTGHFRTVYAHARKLHVRKGQFVDRGQRIAEVGTSGNASGPHLHFEIRQRETPIDPMLYLP